MVVTVVKEQGFWTWVHVP